ncbi:6-phosphogluconate dehydrogenase C-terminal domain-like protein [Xylaria sp. CBS 124048]|nr:6-phosphogluconate dehydrogenase C-terminal domain-like protein [Xylaria sp. CBS 124048]
MRGVCTRHLLHSSARMRNVGNPHNPHNPRNPRNPPPTHPEWFRRIVSEGGTKPPRLYAWTPEDLSQTATATAKPSSYAKKPAVGNGNKGRALDDRERRRIYILGVGNIGRLYAMCLSQVANRPPITLVVHRRELLEHWVAEPGIELTRYERVQRNADFDIEWWTDVASPSGVEVAGGHTLSNLIVATKASDAVPQIDRVRRYLGSESTVTFTQNGMCNLWPPLGDAYVQARFPSGMGPTWLACVTTHGVTSHGPFKSIHAAPADAVIGPVTPGATGKEQVRNLMQAIADAPDLDARQVSTKELWIRQLEKLVINAIINPLTAVLRCLNGELLVARDDALPEVIDRLLDEASQLLCALVADSKSDEILLPRSESEAANSKESAAESLRVSREQLIERFSFPRLRKMVLDVGEKVVENTSSMLQDVRTGKQTEIDDINGWLLDTAKLVDQRCQLPTHEKLVALVKARAALTRDELCAKLLGSRPILED